MTGTKTCIFFLIGFGALLLPLCSRNKSDSDVIVRFSHLVHDLRNLNILDGEVLIVEHDHIRLHERGKEVNQAIARGNDPQFMIGSLTKQFTAVALLRALYDTSPAGNANEKCEWVKKQLHKPLTIFLPPDAHVWKNKMPVWASQVTLHHVLSHTAGIGQEIATICRNKGFPAVIDFMRNAHNLAEVLAIIADQPLQFEPGTQFCYSNIGYHILAEVIANITGMPYERYLQQTLFNPLGMKSTYVIPQGKSYEIKQQDCGKNLVPEMTYDLITDEDPTSPDTKLCVDAGAAVGSGNIISSAQDLLLWNQALHGNKTVLPNCLYQVLIKPNLNNHAYGLWNKNGIIYYSGKIGFYDSILLYIPERDLSLIMLCHVDYNEKTLYQERERINAALTKEIVDPIERDKKISDMLCTNYPLIRGASQMMKFIFDQLIGQ